LSILLILQQIYEVSIEKRCKKLRFCRCIGKTILKIEHFGLFYSKFMKFVLKKDVKNYVSADATAKSLSILLVDASAKPG
jgi:hypothetical protein